MQSAYRQNHSTETALLKVKHDLLLAMDKQRVVFLVLLDMSAAFDLIRDDILVDTLQTHFGITDKALLWVRSYLDGRRQRVEVDGILSREFGVLWGVPQGSCLGPLLFTLYASRLFQEIQHNVPEVMCHTYADDTQLYISFSPITEEENHSLSVLRIFINGYFQTIFYSMIGKLNF